MAAPADPEIRQLAEAVFQRYGHDFRDYAPASFKRRVLQAQERMGLDSVPALQDRVLRDAAQFEALLQQLTVPVSEMFRDPGYFLALRRHALPVLRTYPSLKVWVAGCGGGEEAYSLAILLHEEGLLDRTILYATDINPAALDRARQGIVALAAMPGFTSNYQRAGGRRSFSAYYTAAYDSALFGKALRDSITFADHSLATDAVFSETQLVSCRNVLIYFNRRLQDRALGLFHDSLSHRGFLGLGARETLDFSGHAGHFEPVSRDDRLYRRVAA